MPMRDLGVALVTDAPYITVIVDDLEDRGLVTREANPGDRRSKLVHITAAGREVAQQADRSQSDLRLCWRRLIRRPWLRWRHCAC